MFRRTVVTVFTVVTVLAVGVLPTAAVAAAPTGAAGFTALFEAKNDGTWSGGDQVTSLRAANGLTYWSFGDTALGEQDPATGAYRPGWRLIANTILVQRGEALGATTFGAAVPDAADGDRYWTQGMFQVGSFLYALCQRVRNTPDGFFQFRGVELAKFAFNADGTLAFQGMRNTPSTGAIEGDSTATAQYAADAVVTGGFVYVFGYRNAKEDGFAPHRSYVARVTTGSVETASSWRFHDAAGAWVADRAQAAPILSAQISSVRLIGGRWVLAYKPWNGYGDTVVIEARSTPWGTPLRTATISSPAGTTPKGAHYITYSPQLHPEQPLASGKLLVSIAWNAGLPDVAADADLYKPRFHEVTLP